MILATKKDNTIFVGISICDCCINMSNKDLSLKDNLPFWKVKGEKDCYVGTQKLTFATDLIKYSDNLFKNILDTNSIIENVIPKLKKELAKYNLLTDNNWNNQLIIIKGDKLFHVSAFLEVTEIENQLVLGYENYIHGALDSTETLKPTESILESVRNLNRMKNLQLFPLTVFNTNTKKLKTYLH